MEIKLGSCNLAGWHTQGVWDEGEPVRSLAPGIRVCSSSNRKHLGVITTVGDADKEIKRWNRPSTMVVSQVQIFWMSGPRKGQQQWKDLDSLINYDAYKARIMKELKELEDNENEAAKTGL